MSNHVVHQFNPTPRHARSSEGAFITLQDGRILFAYTRYGPNPRDAGNAVIASRISSDAGRTWSKRDRILLENEGRQNVMSVSLLRLHDGRIALFYLRKDSIENCIPTLRYSADEAKTFTRPLKVISVRGYYVLVNDRVIQLRTGRLIAPMSLHQAQGGWKLEGRKRVPSIRSSAAGLVCFYYSDDAGLTWQEATTRLYKALPDGMGLQEPGIVELTDGRLWCYSRAGKYGLAGMRGRQWQSFSSDGGVTWSDIEASEFISPCSPMSVKRIPGTGELLAIWNDQSDRWTLPPATEDSKGRTPFACALSGDDVRSWRHHRLIEDAPDHGYCYTAIHFVDDAVLLAYCAGGPEHGNPLRMLRIRRITLDELHA